MNLTDAIKYLRKRGMSDESIGRAANVNTTTVWRARKGGQPLYDSAMSIIAVAERVKSGKPANHWEALAKPEDAA